MMVRVVGQVNRVGEGEGEDEGGRASEKSQFFNFFIEQNYWRGTNRNYRTVSSAVLCFW